MTMASNSYYCTLNSSLFTSSTLKLIFPCLRLCIIFDTLDTIRFDGCSVGDIEIDQKKEGEAPVQRNSIISLLLSIVKGASWGCPAIVRGGVNNISQRRIRSIRSLVTVDRNGFGLRYATHRKRLRAYRCPGLKQSREQWPGASKVCRQ